MLEPGARERLIGLLSETQLPLYGVFDAARDGRVLKLLAASDTQSQCLYYGDKADKLARYAPYLVRLAPPVSDTLASLLTEGWGRSWGIYFLCKEPFERIRLHWKSLLYVRTEAGRRLYLRFYDPRVLHPFMDTCPPRNVAAFFGPVTKIVAECGNGEALIAYHPHADGMIHREKHLFSPGLGRPNNLQA
ncbi:MAG: DUF4123 domain-containing protein [Rhodospirillales bacterium]|nr:DUF4123 domain-containing protein [Rhodospirillales bacterium]